MDITENIQLNVDQIDMIVKNHLSRIVGLCKPEIRALLTEATPETPVMGVGLLEHRQLRGQRTQKPGKKPAELHIGSQELVAKL